MASNGELSPQEFYLDATVYPGMFDREYEVSIEIDKREFKLIGSPSDIQLENNQLSPEGTKGRVRVSLVDEMEDFYLIDFPGETLGTSRRAKVPKNAIPVPKS